jgi:AraC family transcriptional regulator, melibiose operon regulatory protein
LGEPEAVAPPLKSFDASRPDFAPYGFAVEPWIARPMERANRHNEIELNYVPNGTLTYLLGGSRVTVPEGCLTAFWAAIPHQVLATTATKPYFVGTIPLAWFLQCRLPTPFIERLLQGKAISERDNRNTDRDALAFEQWRQDLSTRNPDAHRAVLLEVEARLLRLSAHLEKRATRNQAAVDLGASIPRKVEQMATYIARHYTDRIDVDKIAGAAKLHPNYAMGLFRKTFGTTLVEYLTQLRVSHAQRLLVTNDDKILNVAMNSGFASLSRFNEAFARIAGMPPSVFRQRHRVPVNEVP